MPLGPRGKIVGGESNRMKQFEYSLKLCGFVFSIVLGKEYQTANLKEKIYIYTLTHTHTHIRTYIYFTLPGKTKSFSL